jgi:predicted amidophosphoribosyltransferase
MPRLIDSPYCPHCKAKLPDPKPRACPNCAASINQRFLKIGCLTSAPPLILCALGLFELWRSLG